MSSTTRELLLPQPRAPVYAKMDVQMPSVIPGHNNSNNGSGNSNGNFTGVATAVLSPQRIREAKYEVLLFFVELLMEHKSRKLHDLSCLFGSPSFSPAMKQVVGGESDGTEALPLEASVAVYDQGRHGDHDVLWSGGCFPERIRRRGQWQWDERKGPGGCAVFAAVRRHHTGGWSGGLF